MISKISSVKFSSKVGFAINNTRNQAMSKLSFGSTTDSFSVKSDRKVYNEFVKLKNQHADSFIFNEEFVLEGSSAQRLSAQKKGIIVDSNIDKIIGSAQLTIMDTKAKNITSKGDILAFATKDIDNMSFETLSSTQDSAIVKSAIGNKVNAAKYSCLDKSVVNMVVGNQGVFLDGDSFSDIIKSSGSVVLAKESSADIVKLVKPEENFDGKPEVYIAEDSRVNLVDFSNVEYGTVYMHQNIEALDEAPDVLNGEVEYIPNDIFDEIIYDKKNQMEKTSL